MSVLFCLVVSYINWRAKGMVILLLISSNRNIYVAGLYCNNHCWFYHYCYWLTMENKLQYYNR